VPPVKKEEPVIRHTLFDNEVIEEVKPAEVLNDLISTSELIKNIDVVYDEVLAPSVLTADDFVITDVNEVEVVAPEVVPVEEEALFSFDAPMATSEELFEPAHPTEDKVVFQLSEEINDIEVTDHIEVVPVKEQNESGVIRYSLEYPEEEETTPIQAEKVEEDFSFSTASDVVEAEKVEEKIVTENNADIDPFNTSIEESLRLRADARRKKLKEFNYKFRHNANANNVDEIEKEPAYKRMGIDLNEKTDADGAISRTTIGTDSNDDIQLRSNNSFLHDNVD